MALGGPLGPGFGSGNAYPLYADNSIRYGAIDAVVPVLLATLTASNSAILEFKSLIDTTKWKTYFFTGRDIMPATNNVALQFQVSDDNGATYKSGAGQYGVMFSSSTASNTVNNGGSANAFGYCMTVNTANVSYGNSFSHTITLSSGLFDMGGTCIQYTGSTTSGGSITNRAVYPNVNAFKIYMTSGNISTGTFQLWGLA